MSGRLGLTTGEIQGHLRQLLMQSKDLTPEQRYSITSAIEAIEFIKLLSPGLQKVAMDMKGRKNEIGTGNASNRRNPT